MVVRCRVEGCCGCLPGGDVDDSCTAKPMMTRMVMVNLTRMQWRIYHRRGIVTLDFFYLFLDVIAVGYVPVRL
ncbi:hypothetical protein CBR_g12081 [Chara braunii]|uniref:Uncharacterized protein n=1 Tax=Chara braunii TaxID=69332 RepID=A0A388KR12_CHABU|nr:hypothetical protein CBR_g12081 [Chara braunii]|eukprot:GBG72510.1 hypothetical protein CBR_g12081 [Chara braunii]